MLFDFFRSVVQLQWNLLVYKLEMSSKRVYLAMKLLYRMMHTKIKDPATSLIYVNICSRTGRVSKSQAVRFKSSVWVYLIGQLPLYSRNTPAKKYAGENAVIFAKEGVQLACVQTRRPLPSKKNRLSPIFFWGEGGVCTQARENDASVEYAEEKTI